MIHNDQKFYFWSAEREKRNNFTADASEKIKINLIIYTMM